jgi:hypothetical protein
LAPFVSGCSATRPTAARDQIDHQHFRRLDDLLRAAQATLHAVPLVPVDASTALKAVTAEIDAVASFEKTEDEKWYVSAVLIATAMASGEVYALQHPSGESRGSINVSVLDCFFSAPEDCFADLRPCAPVERDTECIKKAQR